MFTIGQLAAQSGVKIETIRYYEKAGLMPQPGRTSGGQRRYSQDNLQRLSFIRQARALGFAIDVIEDLLALAGNAGACCQNADDIARRQLTVVEEKIARLKKLRLELSQMIDCQRSGTIRDCRVIEALSGGRGRKPVKLRAAA